jgi:hypothetical protein
MAGFRRCAIWCVILISTLAACNSQGTATDLPATPVPQITSTFTVQPTRPILPTVTPVATGSELNRPFPTATSGGQAPPSMLQVQVTPAPPGLRPAKDAPCYQATFLKNVTVADGAGFQPSAPILKVWEVQNTGSCEWSEKTVLTFAHGNDFGAPPTIPLEVSVPPGAVIDIALNVRSPMRSGTFQGFWKLQNEMGVPIETLNSPDSELAIKIVVFIPDKPEPGLTFDFTSNFCLAEWRNPDGPLPCPASELKGEAGAVMRSFTPMLENLSKDNEPALMLLPSAGPGGYISAVYPKYTVQEGDRFKGVVGCLANVPKCKVVFELNYSEDGKTPVNVGSWEEVYDGRFRSIDISLDELKGRTVQFILKVSNAGDALDDQVFWLWPRISNPNAVE